MTHKVFMWFLFIMFLAALPVYAATDSFIIQTRIGIDTTPPSTPLNLVATPVATTQIDLTWNASTDNVGVEGYQVFRDGLQIATSTLTTYSNTGLSAGTLYSYYVRAFDEDLNISSSSLSVATTTLSIPPPPPPPSSNGLAPRIELEPLPLEIISLEVIPDTTSVTISFETPGFVRAVIKWGETASFEGGSIAEDSFKKLHTTNITGLRPNTRYWFMIEGENGVGFTKMLTTSSFRTLNQTESYIPPNVTNLSAVRDGNDIKLYWRNPDEAKFKQVRLLANPLFYPSDTVDGDLVYEGSGEMVVDKGRAVPGTTVYYTIFAYDILGNVSSGAIIALRISEDGVVSLPDVETETPPPIEDGDPAISFDDLVFMQESTVLTHEQGTVSIDGSKQLIVSIPYDAVPERLKTILVTIYRENEQGPRFSFLLRVNEAKTAYSAIVAPLRISGLFPISVSLYDYEARKISTAKGTLNSDIIFPVTIEERKGLFSFLIQYSGQLFEYILILILAFGLWLLLKKKRRRLRIT